MTAEDFIDGLLERGYHVARTRIAPQTIIPRIEGDDPLFEWLQSEMGVVMRPYKPEQVTRPDHLVYEARLHRAKVEVDTSDFKHLTKQEQYLKLVERRALAVWHAAEPDRPPKPVQDELPLEAT